MKTLYSKLALLCILLFAIGCQRNDDEGIKNMGFTTVNKLLLPAQTTTLDLTSLGTTQFKWEPATAENGGYVLYQVAFDKEGGDFSNPLKVVNSDGNGGQPTLNISFKDLNAIAALAGIKPESIGTLRWTVFTTKGLEVQKPTVSSTVKVERPIQLDTPAQLYLTGSATEGGADINNALPMRRISDSGYEIYTSLKAGDYQFVTGKSAGAEKIYLNGIKLKTNGATTYTGDNKVYRIRVDFAVGVGAIDEVSKVELWFPPFRIFIPYNYAGTGTWKVLNQQIQFKTESWGDDERYKFKYTFINSEGASFVEWYGSANRDNSRPDANTPASFWNLVRQTQGNWDWDYTFKFKGELNGAKVDGIIDMNTYTHNFIKL